MISSLSVEVFWGAESESGVKNAKFKMAVKVFMFRKPVNIIPMGFFRALPIDSEVELQYSSWWIQYRGQSLNVKIINRISYLWGFSGSEYDFEVEIAKFKMTDPIVAEI